MPQALTKSMKLRVKDWLKAEWNAANTSNVTPGFSTGWVSRQGSFPLVTVTEGIPEVPEGGGASGFTGMRGDGSGPVQRRRGSVTVIGWAHRGDGSGVNPKQLVEEMGREAERIVLGHVSSETDLEYVTVRSTGELPPDTTEQPTLFRWQVLVGYGWMRTP